MSLQFGESYPFDTFCVVPTEHGGLQKFILFINYVYENKENITTLRHFGCSMDYEELLKLRDEFTRILEMHDKQ